MQTFSDLARAAYCPRQLYYARQGDDHAPPPRARRRIDLAFRYPELLDATDEVLLECPIDRSPDAYRGSLAALKTRAEWSELVSPADERVLLEGKDARGIAHKLLDVEEGLVPSLVSPGSPPDRGVWEPQRVRAVAAATALGWERGSVPDRVIVEYPASGVVRTVQLTTRNRAIYRRTLRTVRRLDGPPPRLEGSSKCGPCEYSDQCGVRTRSLRSLLGL